MLAIITDSKAGLHFLIEAEGVVSDLIEEYSSNYTDINGLYHLWAGFESM